MGKAYVCMVKTASIYQTTYVHRPCSVLAMAVFTPRINYILLEVQTRELLLLFWYFSILCATSLPVWDVQGFRVTVIERCCVLYVYIWWRPSCAVRRNPGVNTSSRTRVRARAPLIEHDICEHIYILSETMSSCVGSRVLSFDYHSHRCRLPWLGSIS